MDLIFSYYLFQKYIMKEKKQEEIIEKNRGKTLHPLKKSESFSKTCENCGQGIVWCNCRINNK